MRAWLRAFGLALVGAAVALNVALLAYGDPAALPGPLGQLASEHVVPWAQDALLPWLQPLGILTVDEAVAAPEEEAALAEPTAEPEPAASLVPEPTAAATPPPTPSPLAATPTPGVVSVLPSPSPTPRTIAVPVRIVAPSIGLDAPVIKVGVDQSGAMGTPKTAEQVGWYGPRAGEAGNALFAGHVDWVVAGKVTKGSFYLLQKLNPGDLVKTRAADGKTETFRVEWKRYFDAASAPVDEIAGPTAAPSITLITCGGPFDRSLKTYLGRWVVRATRVVN